MSNIDRLKELADLHDKGLLTREQFDEERDRLLAESSVRNSGNVLPESVGAYRITALIGRGGMGTVYRARHRSDEVARRQNGDVAIKVMHSHLASNAKFQERFEREASLGLKLNHENIVGVYDLVVDGTTLALVMELVEGRTLAEMIGKETGPIPWDRARPMFSQLLSAVGAAHEQGVVHRDLKPENVIVDTEGHLNVADFGIAKELGSKRTKTGTGMGTAGYMAPEQYRDAKSIDQRADIYALGMTLYEMLAGRLPWPAETTEFEVLQLKAEGRIQPPTEFYPDIPPAVVAAVMASVEVDPADRPESAALFQALLDGESTPAASASSSGDGASAAASSPAASATSGGASSAGSVLSAPAAKRKQSKAPIFLALGAGCLVVCGLAGVGGLLVWLAASEGESDYSEGVVWEDPSAGAEGAPAAGADGVGATIRSLPDGGSDAWDAAVQPVLLARYDFNSSGTIDRVSEVQAIPCDTWKALDDGVRQKWEYGLRIIYGFQADKIWVGYALGFDESMRPNADAMIVACESQFSSPSASSVPPAAPPSIAPTPAPTPPPSTGGSVASRIRSRPEQGGGSEWDNAVKPIMVSAYDSNGSGWIDRSSEVAAVPCSTWKALDDGVKEKWDYGLRTIYGFEAGYSWIGYAVGFDESIRTTADARLAACASSGWTSSAGGSSSSSSASRSSSSSGGGGGGSPASRIRARGEQGGSTEWDNAVKPIMVSAYDSNGSGSIDLSSESRAIPCSTWKALDDGVREKWDYGLRTIYGFEGGVWLGNLVGFDESLRSTSDGHLAACESSGWASSGGSSSSSSASTSSGSSGSGQSVASKIRGRSEQGGSSAWDSAVKPIMIAAYDLNGSGSINNRAEVSAVPCATWQALDAGVKEKWDYGLRTIYGFEAGYSWIGYAVGFDESVRSFADQQLVSCGG